MPGDQSAMEVPTGYWVACGWQNHVLPTAAVRGRGGKLTAVCGVLLPPDEIAEKDDRQVCAWCGEEARTGRVRIVPPPS